jgi:hypothetical protein
MAAEHDAPTDIPADHLAWRSLVLFGVGAAVAALGALVSGTMLDGRLLPPGPVTVWAADRGASRVYGLDANCIVARAIDVGSPLRVVSAGERGVWIVRARDAHAQSAHDLVLATSAGRMDLELEIEPCIDLSATRGGDALCVTRDDFGRRRAWRISRDGDREVLVEDPAEAGNITSIAGLSGSIAIGTQNGELLRIRSDGSEHSCAVVARSIVDLAAGPHADSVWVLDSEREVLLIDAHDRVVWRSATGLDARTLAPIPSAELVWVTESHAPRARRLGRIDGGNTDDVECSDFGTTAAECAVGLPGGGVLFALPGALVRRDERGRPAPGQGGFHTLVDVAPR